MLRPGVRSPTSPFRHAMAGPLQIMPHRQRTLPADRLPLHRTQFCARSNGRAARATSLVKRPCQLESTTRRSGDAPPGLSGTGRGSACPRGGLSHMAPPGRQRRRSAPDPATSAAGTRTRRCQIPGNGRKSPWPARLGSSTRSTATIR